MLWAEQRGAGTPVVLLHGAGMDSRLWDPVFPVLAKHCRVIRYDARGLGRSAPPSGPFSDVADLRAILDRFGVSRAALVGLSMGGETAVDFTLAHPNRVSALALIGTSLSGFPWPEGPDLTAYAAARRTRDHVRLAELELSMWAAMGRAAPGGELIAEMVADNALKRLDSEALVGHPDREAFSRVDRIAVPTLVVHGDRDHSAIGVIAERLVAAIPGARGTVVAEADHYLPLRTPERLAELLLTHLA
jgi:pimeloyl-ACP methyl ester carboxylesterase